MKDLLLIKLFLLLVMGTCLFMSVWGIKLFFELKKCEKDCEKCQNKCDNR
jgi:hypothetical protein